MAQPLAVVTSPSTTLPVDLAGVAEAAREYMLKARAENTARAYRADWQDFAGWCSEAGLVPLPASPETVGLYLAARAKTHRPGTLDRRLVAITAAHRAAAHRLDTRHAAIRETLAGIKRTHGTAQAGKAPAIAAEIRAMVEAQPDSLLGVRNHAMLLLGFDSACRRSEIAALDVEDLAFTGDGIVLTLRKAKTDQEGAGRQIGIPYRGDPAVCTVRAARRWLDASGIRTGALFREIGTGGELVAPYVDARGRQRGERLSDKSVALVVKAAAKAAGLNPALYAGHSLRSGFATSAAQAGAAERAIMAQTGHRSLPMVRRYIRLGTLFSDNAAAAITL